MQTKNSNGINDFKVLYFFVCCCLNMKSHYYYKAVIVSNRKTDKIHLKIKITKINKLKKTGKTKTDTVNKKICIRILHSMDRQQNKVYTDVNKNYLSDTQIHFLQTDTDTSHTVNHNTNNR